jgi:hypothetical protein
MVAPPPPRHFRMTAGGRQGIQIGVTMRSRLPHGALHRAGGCLIIRLRNASKRAESSLEIQKFPLHFPVRREFEAPDRPQTGTLSRRCGTASRRCGATRARRRRPACRRTGSARHRDAGSAAAAVTALRSRPAFTSASPPRPRSQLSLRPRSARRPGPWSWPGNASPLRRDRPPRPPATSTGIPACR